LLFEEKILSNKELFKEKVKSISKLLGIKPDWLMAVMRHESNLKHDAVNSVSNATGLIQFMPTTAISLGTSVEKLKLMTNVEQLDYVYKYYNLWKTGGAEYKEPYHLFLTTFYPVALLKNYVSDKNYKFGSEKSDTYAKTVATQNKGFDLDNDGYITTKDYKTYHNLLFAKYGLEVGAKKYVKGLIIVTSVSSLIAVTYFLNKKYKFLPELKQLKINKSWQQQNVKQEKKQLQNQK
jgi:hypothetical protein